MPKSQLRRTAKSAGTGWPAVRPTCSPGCPAPRSVSIHCGFARGASPRPAAGGRGTCSGSRHGCAEPLTSALHRWRWSAVGRRRRGRGGAPGPEAALRRPHEAERPRLGRSCAPRAPATALRRRPQMPAKAASSVESPSSISASRPAGLIEHALRCAWPVQNRALRKVAATLQDRNNRTRQHKNNLDPRLFRQQPPARSRERLAVSSFRRRRRSAPVAPVASWRSLAHLAEPH